MAKPIRDLTGNVYGQITVEKRVEGIRNRYGLRTAWLCSCACGKKKIIASDSLAGGRSKSCGACVRRKSINHRWVVEDE